MNTLPLELKLEYRHRVRERHVLHSWYCEQTLLQLLEEDPALRRRRIAIALQAELTSHESIGTPAVVEALEPLQPAKKESCACEENHSECHFADDQAVPKTMM